MAVVTIRPLQGYAPVWVVTASLRGNGVQDIIVAEAPPGTYTLTIQSTSGVDVKNVNVTLIVQ